MLDQFLSDPSKIGALGMMAIAVAALMRGWVIPFSHYSAVIAQYETRISELTKEKNEFKDMVIHAVDTTERALQVAATRTGK